MSRNHLDQETSPYLLQHSGNPVHWRPWGPAALAEARAAGRPILLSVGYAACHWCHVMAHESFEDPVTADLMNRLYIPIKVDREERPDIDLIYQTALACLGQPGGWPLTMFLTPDGHPFWGGTYFPPSPRYGRPSFRDVLSGVSDTYARDPDRIAGNVTALTDALHRMAGDRRGALPTVADLDRAGAAILRATDPHHGGLSGAPKFPQVPVFHLLWRAGYRRQDNACQTAVKQALTAMCQGGIYDHLGGGFARYSTDERWLVPHFEKMLYDNAQLLDLMTAVWRQDPRPLFADRIAGTIDWLLREMVAGNGAFAATLDADSEGEEGKYYVWTDAEVRRLLPPDQADLIARVYDVTPAGNWEGRSILHRRHPGGVADDIDQHTLNNARAVLLAARQARIPPARDDKVLADWNGMMITALARASFVFDRPDWLDAARQAYAALLRDQQRDGRLCHSFRQGRPQPEAMLDDYAHLALAALMIFEVSGEPSFLDQARHWVDVADVHYWDPAGGGYFLTADDAPGLIVRTRSATDNAVPSGNGVMAEVLARLFHQTGDDRYRRRADALISAFTAELDTGFPGMATLLNGWELLETALQVIVVGPGGDPVTKDLLAVLRQAADPNLVMTQLAPDAILPPGHPAAAKVAAAQGRATAFVCRGPVCGAPVHEAEALRRLLNRSQDPVS